MCVLLLRKLDRLGQFTSPGLTVALVFALSSALNAENKAAANPVSALREYLQQPRDARPLLEEQEFAKLGLSKSQAKVAHALLWKDHAEHIRQSRAEEMRNRVLSVGKHKMPFFYHVFGQRPKNGRSLYISLHGGGGAPARVNDQQWENQKRLYRLTEGVYVAPRAPTNTWNLWHEPHIDTLFDRLIENLIVFENVDPNRVYVMGYSAGGDGVYQLGPRMADRWAAAAMMAGHPNNASPVNLRNTPFTIHVGGNDAAYRRNAIAREWGDKLAALHREDPEGYVHWTKIYEGKGHWLNREDAAAIPWMAKFTRNPTPSPVVWQPNRHRRFYWLAAEKLPEKAVIKASYNKQTVTINKPLDVPLKVRLRDAMLDLDESVQVEIAGNTVFSQIVPRTIRTIATTLSERGDPTSMFSAEIILKPTVKD